MNREHVIDDELFHHAITEIGKGHCFIAYNTIHYFLDQSTLYFFKTHDEAYEFAANNISEYDDYKVIRAASIDELLQQIPYGEQLNFQISKNISIMNEKNFDYLKDQIKYHGFGETLHPALQEQLKKDTAEFSLAFKTEVNKKEMEATLHFKKSSTSELYFFNTYDARLKNEKDETVSQTFYLNNGSGVTLKEAYNLLNGRAVHKEFINQQEQPYKAWIQLDFSAKDKHGNYERKTFHENYGYDLKEALSYFPLKELRNEDEMKALLKSLEKGNVQQVTMTVGGSDSKFFIEANPQFKGIHVYTSTMAKLDREQQQAMMEKPEIKKDKKQSLEGEDKLEKKSVKLKKDEGLVKKKESSPTKKGMSLH